MNITKVVLTLAFIFLSFVSGRKLSDAEARTLVTRAGMSVSSKGSCNDRNNPDCTSFDQINENTIFGIITFKDTSGCAIVITGGTETGHKSGKYSHWNGYKLDIRKSNCVTNYIQGHYSWINPNKYQSPNGDVFFDEGNHWDITFY